MKLVGEEALQASMNLLHQMQQETNNDTDYLRKLKSAIAPGATAREKLAH